jgi:uncharacterized protein YqgC (DUF456 family)
MKKWLRIAFAILLLLAGVVSSILPILPGWLLIGVAILLLAPDVPMFQKLLDKIEERFPSAREPLEKCRRWLQ